MYMFNVYVHSLTMQHNVQYYVSVMTQHNTSLSLPQYYGIYYSRKHDALLIVKYSTVLYIPEKCRLQHYSILPYNTDENTTLQYTKIYTKIVCSKTANYAIHYSTV